MRPNEFKPEDLFAQIHALDDALKCERAARTTAEARAEATNEALAAAGREFEAAIGTMSAMADLLLARPLDAAERRCAELLHASARSVSAVLGADAETTMFEGLSRARGEARELASSRLFGRALVVEDNAANQVLIGAYLDAFGLSYHCAATGEAALTAMRATRFDVVLMDVMMPGMDGVETARRIRALPGSAGRVAMIGLSAGDVDQSERYFAAGMTAFLTKPINARALFDAISPHVSSPAPPRAAAAS